MMTRLWSIPPHTLGMVRPACCATSTNWTGEGPGLDTAARRRAGSFHFQSGVARASVSVLPSTKREEPRKRRRGKFMDCDDYKDRRLCWDTVDRRCSVCPQTGGYSPVGACFWPCKRAIAKESQQITAGQSVTKIENFTPIRKALSPNAADRCAVIIVLMSSSQIHPPV